MAKRPKFRERDTAELAVWISDEDKPHEIEHWKNTIAPTKFKESADAAGVTVGPLRFYTLRPGEGRAGHPPKGLTGSNMRLLVAECDVVGFKPAVKPYSFLAELSQKELQTLREATRRAWHPTQISDQQCDLVIEKLGPQAMEKLIAASVTHESRARH